MLETIPNPRMAVCVSSLSGAMIEVTDKITLCVGGSHFHDNFVIDPYQLMKV